MMVRREINAQSGEETEFADAPPSGSPPPDYSAIDTAALNAALAQDGSVVRALAAVMLSEVNILRTNASLPARTQVQFVAALKAQMRT